MNMNYELVTLSQKTVAGLRLRTQNGNPEMPMQIGAAWQRFGGVCGEIPGRKNGKAIGRYTNYAKDETGEYDFYACCEVQPGENLPQGVDSAVIPAGVYARFTVRGDVQKDVADFWQQLWGMQLNRTFQADFEEYQEDGDETCEIHIYIGVAQESWEMCQSCGMPLEKIKIPGGKETTWILSI